MESTCIRCGKTFESDTWDMDLCPNCDSELIEMESDDRDGFTELSDDLAEDY